MILMSVFHVLCLLCFVVLLLSPSFFAAMGRIGALLGNVMFGNLSGASIVLPLFVTGGTLVVAAISGAMLPETKDTNLA